MNRILQIALLITSATGLLAQDIQTRTVQPFSSIAIESNAKVYLTPSQQQQVQVKLDDKDDEVTTEVHDNVLHIDGDPSVIYILTPALERISISGSGTVASDSVYKATSMSFNISGHGKIVMPVEANAVDIDISGYGKMRLEGSASSVDLDISGNSVIDGEDLVVNNAKVSVSGVSKAQMDVRDSLDMRVSGVSSFYYKTEPGFINREVSGIGKYGIIDNDDRDTTSVHLGKKRVIIIGNESDNDDDDDDDKFDIDINVGDNDKPKPPKRSRSHWAGIDLGFNGYFHDKMSTDLPESYDFLELNEGKSLAVGINIWKFDIPLYKRYIMLTTGVGMTLNNYRFGSDETLLSDTSKVAAGFDYKDTGEQISYSKNKLAVNYVTVPVLLQFNTHRLLKKSVHFGAGLLFSYKYNSHLKLVYEENGDKQKAKRRDDFNIEPFRYDATVRIGYRNYTLFGSYAITELFKSKSGPTLHPFTIGLQLAGW